jgi:hypothetical protein
MIGGATLSAMIENPKKAGPAPVRETYDQTRTRLLLNYWMRGGDSIEWFDAHIEALVRAVHPDHPQGVLFPKEPLLPFGKIRAA